MRAPAVLAVLTLALPTIGFSPLRPGVPGETRKHTAWVSRVIAETATVKPGMTRADLLKVFTTEGGLSTPLSRRYVYRGCPYVKVDAEFTPVARPPRDTAGRVTMVESPNDIIKSISKPFLEWSILD